MHTLQELKKQQVGLRLHKYLVDEIDILSKEFSLNRTDIIAEAIRSYVETQKANLSLVGVENACKELIEIKRNQHNQKLTNLDDLINEL